MDFLKLSGGKIDFYKKTLDFRSERHNLIASNVANAETPHYKASDIRFEDQMKEAMEANEGKGLKRTHGKHFPSGVPNINELKGEVVIDDSPGRLDGNNVNMEEEMAKMAANTLLYNAVTQLVGGSIQGIKNAIEQGGRR